MKAEQRKRLEQNELATRLSEMWSGSGASSPRANWVWTALLAVLAVTVGGWLYLRHSTRQNEERWADLSFAFNTDALDKIVKDDPASMQAAIARLQVARLQVTEGLSEIAVLSPDRRLAAAKKLADARLAFGDVAANAKLPPALIQEALAQQARVEETLASVPKSEGGGMHGSLDQATKLYEQLQARFPASVAGEAAARRIEDLKKQKALAEQLYSALAQDHGQPPAAPAAPAGVTPALPVGPPAEKP